MNRIDVILNYVDLNKVVADIGSDHGITAIRVYEEKKPKKVIATDISKNSLQKLEDKLIGLKYDIDTLVTDGIEDLPQNVEQIIISGMGGYLIAQILERGLEIAKKADKLILQGNNSKEYLRHFLHDNGFLILDEKNVEDEGFIYDIIVARYNRGGMVQKYNNEFEYLYGYKNLKEKNPLTIEVIKSDKNHLENIKSKLENTDSKKGLEKSKILNNKIKEYEDLLCKLEK